MITSTGTNNGYIENWIDFPDAIYFFLDMARKNRPVKCDGHEYWASQLAVPTEFLFSQWVSESLFRIANDFEMVNAIYSVDELKQTLRDQGLLLSGTKQVLIERLKSENRGVFNNLISGPRLVVITEYGQQQATALSEQMNDEKAQERRAMTASYWEANVSDWSNQSFVIGVRFTLTRQADHLCRLCAELPGDYRKDSLPVIPPDGCDCEYQGYMWNAIIEGGEENPRWRLPPRG